MQNPDEKHIRMYWAVSQGDDDLPCALFLLQSDAEEWVKQANKSEGAEYYKVIEPCIP